MEVFEIFDEPFDVKRVRNITMQDLMIPKFDSEIIGPEKSQIQELMARAKAEPNKFEYSFDSTIQNIFFSEQRADSLIILVGVLFSFRTKPDQSKTELTIVNYLHYINRVDILSQDLSSNLIRHLDPEIAFKEDLFLCPGNEALLIVSPETKLVVAYEGQHSRYVYNTSFFEKSEIHNMFCLPNEGKMAVVFKEGTYPGP